MDIKRKKELLNEWKMRRPEMGIISISCTATGNQFLGISKDTKADLNSNRFRLSVNLHANKQIQKLWNEHGEQQFLFSVVKTLEYKDQPEEQTEKLLALLEKCQLDMPQAGRI